MHKARAFLAVAEELHFGRAAERLHIAQPPLSRMIRAIEEDLGAALFVRNPRRVELTVIGRALVEPARELVMQSERIKDLVRRMNDGEIGRVMLGFSGSSVNALVSRLVHRVRAELPGLTLELAGAQLSQRGLARLRAGELDAVIGRWDALPEDVDSIVLAEEELFVALPEGHRLTEATEIAVADLAVEPWVVLPGGGDATLTSRLHLLGERGGFVPRIVETAADSATQLLLVDAGRGVALTFSGVRDNVPAHSVVFRPVVPNLGRAQVRLAWRSSDENPLLASVIRVAQLPSVVE